MGKFNMSIKETKQIRIIEELSLGKLKQKTAAEILELSERQIRNKLKRFKEKGYKGLEHRK